MAMALVKSKNTNMEQKVTKYCLAGSDIAKDYPIHWLPQNYRQAARMFRKHVTEIDVKDAIGALIRVHREIGMVLLISGDMDIDNEDWT